MNMYTAVSAAASLFMTQPAALATQLGQATLDKCVSNYLSTPTSAPALKADVPSCLEELDVYAALQTAHALIRLVSGAGTPAIEDGWEDVDPCSGDVVGVCVKHLRESMVLLQRDVDAYEARVQAHQAKWFASWRTLDTRAIVDSLWKHKRLFDVRLRMLLNIVAAVQPACVTPRAAKKETEQQVDVYV